MKKNNYSKEKTEASKYFNIKFILNKFLIDLKNVILEIF